MTHCEILKIFTMHIKSRRDCKFMLEPKTAKTSKMPSTIARMKFMQNYSIWNWQRLILIALALFLISGNIAECQHIEDLPFYAPKSHGQPIDSAESIMTLQQTSGLSLESSISTDISQPQEQSLCNEENETRQHTRVERSALPILNDNFPKTGPNDVQFPSEIQKEAAAGRYFQYDIKPTGTYENLSENPETTERKRAGKTLKSSAATAKATAKATAEATASAASSFLSKGGPRPLMSGSPINPTSSTATPMAAVSATATPHNARQNPNPDIQDIITGIVKLLNGNVNVHANTQGIRRPQASRINNRGPPRISDVQTLPLDFDTQKPQLGSSIRPPPYSGPFDRPDRPFITGVPIPEQIVPYRPGFVSNRPPWHRNKPRPPITTTMGGRRPIPQYKPLPATQMSPPPENEPTNTSPIHQYNAEGVHSPTSADSNDTADAPKPTDTSYDSEFSGEDNNNNQYIEVSENDTSDSSIGAGVAINEKQSQPVQTSPISMKKEEQNNTNKKKPTKNKTSEKRKPSLGEQPSIIEIKSSVIQTASTQIISTYAPIPMESAEDVDVDPSSEEVIFMTPSKTPALETALKTAARKTQKPSASKTSSTTISTSPLSKAETSDAISSSSTSIVNMHTTISPTKLSTSVSSTPSTTLSTTSTTTTTTTTTTATITTTTENISTNASPSTSITPLPPPSPPSPPSQYQPRPGIVLDDPEFKPGGRPRPQRPPPSPPLQHPSSSIQPTRQHLPPGYGEIFDVTLSAIQGPGSGGGSGSQHTINIKPYGSYGNTGTGLPESDIIVSAAGDDGFVSIDGKRTYINLFGDPTDPPAGVKFPTTPATAIPQLTGSSSSSSGSSQGAAVTQNTLPSLGTGYGVPETEIVELKPTRPQQNSKPPYPQSQSPTTNSGPTRPHYRPRTTQPPVRIDTCIVGDDSTCDQAQHERCKTENGVSSCHCRPGYSRRKHREPCRKVISFYLGMRVDRIYEHRIVWDNKLLDYNSEPYGQLSYEAVRAIDSAMSMTPYSDEFMDAKVNNIYHGDPNFGGSGVFVNLTIKLDESVETLRPNLRSDVQKHLLGVLHRRNNNIGNSVLYVTSPEGAISALHDLDECQSNELNDCHASAACSNSWGSFRCVCEVGYRDPWADQPQRAGRDCQSCPDAYCNNRGTCSYNEEGSQACACDSNHYGGQCEIDGEVLGVAIGASVAAVIIIVLTLVCLIMWSRRWQREQKNAMGSPVFGYMNTSPLKSAGLAQPGYQVTLEDRMRWAQIADVMAQTNHYGAEPIGPTRPSSAMFGYPNLHNLGMGTMGGLSMQSTMQMHHNANMAPPVPLPRRLGLSSRSNGMRTLENSSSSEEEDRTDLLGRNFQVPRPKSRSNGSIANQSGIYYDVDYEPSGNGIGNTSVDHLNLYGSQNQSSTHSHMGGNSHIPGPQGIPMSTYTSGRAPSSYYMK